MGGTNARSAPMSEERWIKNKSFISKYFADTRDSGEDRAAFRSFSLGWNGKLKREGAARWIE